MSVEPQRILLVRKRSHNAESGGFAFIEFNSTAEASRALSTIEKNKAKLDHVIVSFIHLGVFLPVIDEVEERFKFRSASGMNMKYWDPNFYVSEYKPPQFGDEAGVEAVIKQYIQPESLKKRKLEEEVTITRKPKITTTKIPNKSGMSSHIQRWQSKHDELHKSSKQYASFQQSFGDHDRIVCFLCYRKFETSSQLNNHERNSELHLYNLTVEAKLNKAKDIARALNETKASQ
jgi:hypothetical protein